MKRMLETDTPFGRYVNLHPDHTLEDMAEYVEELLNLTNLYANTLCNVRRMALDGRKSAKGHYCNAFKKCEAIINSTSETMKVINKMRDKMRGI